MVVVLLAGAGLLIRSYIKVDLGGHGIFAVHGDVPSAPRRALQPATDRSRGYFKELMAKLEASARVQAAGAVSDLPLAKSESLGTFWVDGFPNKDYQTDGRRDGSRRIISMPWRFR